MQTYQSHVTEVHPLIRDMHCAVGDSFGKFIDASFPRDCLMGVDLVPTYRIEYGNVSLGSGRSNEIVGTVKRSFDTLSLGPEDFCYVGVEGNPVFTSRLKELEARVLGSVPKPVSAVHFYTETVGAGTDGPTILYLDNVNPHVNFWGSSMYEAHPDVQKTATNNQNQTVKAPVMGISLATLLQRSVKKERGAYVLMKVDIEGGEYSLLTEGADALCNFASAGVTIDLAVEWHPWIGTGDPNNNLVAKYKEVEAKILACNVTFVTFVNG
jgi:hypothetical protein